MTLMNLPHDRKRARSGGEKEARRAAILVAARRVADRVGFDAVTMQAVAAEAGLSKGALYTYVRSKEELFLALFVAAMEAVAERIEAAQTQAALEAALAGAPADTPLFLPLLGRLTAVIEANVADGPLVEGKRRMHAIGLRVAAAIARRTGAREEQARAASLALLLAMQGAAQFDIAARRDLDGLPEDVAALMRGQAFAATYPATVRLILAGLG